MKVHWLGNRYFAQRVAPHPAFGTLLPCSSFGLYTAASNWDANPSTRSPIKSWPFLNRCGVYFRI